MSLDRVTAGSFASWLLGLDVDFQSVPISEGATLYASPFPAGMGTQSNLAPSFEWLERRLSFYYEMQLSLDDLIADGTDPLLPAFPDLVRSLVASRIRFRHQPSEKVLNCRMHKIQKLLSCVRIVQMRYGSSVLSCSTLVHAAQRTEGCG